MFWSTNKREGIYFHTNLTNHEISVAPMKRKVAEDASFKLLNELDEESISVRLLRKKAVNVFFTTF